MKENSLRSFAAINAPVNSVHCLSDNNNAILLAKQLYNYKKRNAFEFNIDIARYPHKYKVLETMFEFYMQLDVSLQKDEKFK